MEKLMTLKEAIQKNDQWHLYVASGITSGTTQYLYYIIIIIIKKKIK